MLTDMRPLPFLIIILLNSVTDKEKKTFYFLKKYLSRTFTTKAGFKRQL